MSKVTKIALAEMVEDMSIYPRHAIDDANVQSLTLALQAGTELPPVVADRKSKRIIDGWHRCRAYKRFQGPEASVPVVLESFASEREMLERAVELNAAHGRRMDVIDLTRSILMMEQFGTSKTRIAVLLSVPEARVEKLRIRVAKASRGDESVPGTKQIPLKRAARHLSGQTLTTKQAKAHKSMPGTSLVLTARQIRMAIDSDLLDRTDERLMSELSLLFESLKSLFASAR